MQIFSQKRASRHLMLVFSPSIAFLGSPTDANEVHPVGRAEASVALMSAGRSVCATRLPNATGCRLNKPLRNNRAFRLIIGLLLGYYWVIIGLLSQQKADEKQRKARPNHDSFISLLSTLRKFTLLTLNSA